MTHTTPTAITLTGANIASLRRLIETHPDGDERLQDVLDEHYAAAEDDRLSRDEDEDDTPTQAEAEALLARPVTDLAAARRARYGTLPTL